MSEPGIFNAADYSLSPEDIKFLQEKGISLTEANRQLELLRSPPYFAKLERPATIGDGILLVDSAEIQRLVELHENAAEHGRFTKFVPASGAATRMFRDILSILERDLRPKRIELDELAKSGAKDAKAVTKCLAYLSSFPFFKELQALFDEPLAGIKATDDYVRILEKLLMPDGLGYSSLPKGLIPFHSYDGETRTPFEEHLVEATFLVKDSNKLCRLHFTVSPEHLPKFEALLESRRSRLEKLFDAKLEVNFSVQKERTDMLCLDPAGRPFYGEDGNLMLRPGGHGALLVNLMELGADLAIIKNIDNVQPDAAKPAVIKYMKILSGVLLEIEDKVSSHLKRLHSEELKDSELEEILKFAKNELFLPVKSSEWLQLGNAKRKAEFLTDLINRPIRVCGMVRNTGEPGGGPFWVHDDGTLRLQIIEGAQVDLDDSEQSKIFASSTHFNPVNIICSLRDFRGQSFDLTKFAREEAIIKTKKSHRGKDLIACERPGLWNGSMDGWISLFVEIPETTFTPVKSVLDFLRK